ncbi:MAG: YIP1 family protein [Polyangiales bacterium]
MPEGAADPAGLPAGAACAHHPERDATRLCARCGSFACEQCVFSALEQRPICRACAEGGLGEPIPWERRREIGRLRAFWRTTKVAMRTPTRFYRTPPTEEGQLWPVVYGVLAYTAGQLGSYLFMALLVLLGGGIAAAFAPEPEIGGILFGYFGCWTVGMFPLVLLQAPVYALLGILAGAAMSHGTLALFRVPRGSFEQTLRVVAFANAPYILYVVPCVGPLVGLVGVVVLEVIGLREVHRLSTDKAVLAAVGYRVLGVVLFVGGYVALVALGLAAEGLSRG